MDFGFFIPLFSLGNQVWFDDNNNGLIDPLETFVDSALVILHYYDPGSMTCYVLDSQYTDSNGLYLFDSLFMGQYLVEVAASNFGPGGALQGYNSSSAGVTLNTVSYTHLDVYKRQTLDNNASAFQPLYDPLGIDILPAGIDFLPDSGMMAGYIIQTDNSKMCIRDRLSCTYCIQCP